MNMPENRVRIKEITNNFENMHSRRRKHDAEDTEYRPEGISNRKKCGPSPQEEEQN